MVRLLDDRFGQSKVNDLLPAWWKVEPYRLCVMAEAQNRYRQQRSGQLATIGNSGQPQHQYQHTYQHHMFSQRTQHDHGGYPRVAISQP